VAAAAGINMRVLTAAKTAAAGSRGRMRVQGTMLSLTTMLRPSLVMIETVAAGQWHG
jgi:hypothetical protein